MREINDLLDQKQLEKVEVALKEIDENELSPNEVSLKRYLLGRFYVGLNDIEKAIFNFELALSGAGDDLILKSQAYLGLSMGYFKIGIYERALESLVKVNEEHLSQIEKVNSYNIGYQISKAFQNQELYEKSLVGLVSMLGEGDFKSDSNYRELFSLLSAKSLSDQRDFTEILISKKNIPLKHIALNLIENFIYSGRSLEATELLSLIEVQENSEELINIINQLKSRLVDDRKVNSRKLGIILPLSGKYKKYGIQALYGVQSAYDYLLKNKGYELKIRDSKSSPVVASFYAKELFEKEKVGMIVGGLSSGEAKSIFLEVKNKQIPFLSLAQVFLPREKKDRFLIELLPSIESEVNELTSEENIERLGKNGSIIFPLDEAGEIYFNELFKMSSNRFKLVDAINFDPKEGDFRDPVKKLLKLKYIKLREDEYNLMKKYYDSEENVSVRRVQTLSPKIDFDWVFLPIRPLEAIQLLPGFNYYDAFNTLMIGPSTWNNPKVRALGRKNRKLHFLDEKMIESERVLREVFY